MAYTGRVSVGGSADTRELPGLSIGKLAVGPMDNNAYLVRCRATGEGVLVDAANDAGRLLDWIGEAGIRAVVTTHQHPDHWQALSEVVAATGATTVAHPADAAALPVPVDDLVEHGGTVRVGQVLLRVIHLRGHTPGSIALCYQDATDGPENPDGHPHLFTGDSLFPGGPGKTTNPGDFTSLMDDLEERVFSELPDATWVYPGHGNDTTLGAERPAIPTWRARGW